MNILRRMLVGAAAAAMALSLTSVSGAQQVAKELSSESALEAAKERGALKIGLSLFVPWSMRDKNGELIGFELDVGRKLAEDMGLDPEFVPTAWDGIIPALLSGKFDVIISGMSITPARNLTVNFTEPYAFSGLTIVGNKSMTEGMSEADFNKPEVTFAARRGATPATVIQTVFPNATLRLFDEDGAATQEVLNGNAHATMASEPGPTHDVAKYPETLHKPLDKVFVQSGEAFAMRKGDPDSLNFFNNWIQMHWRNGWLEERQNYWFKSLEWQDLVDQ